jgi:hypothetical protein
VLVQVTGGRRHQVELLLLAGLEAILPLAVAMVALSIVSRDSCRELQLSMPTHHLVTIGRRLGLLFVAAAVLSLGYSAAVVASGFWSGPEPAGSVLVWAAPAIWLSGAAILAGAVTRSLVLASSAVGLLWIVEQILSGAFTGNAVLRQVFLFYTTRTGDGAGWAANRLWLILTGLAFMMASAVLLARPERMLTEEEA